MSRQSYSEIIVDQNQAQMLDGDTYRFFSFGDIPASGVKEYLFFIPDGIDSVFYGRALQGRATDAIFQTFGSPTFSNEGTPITDQIFNRNADYSSTSLIQAWEDPTIISDGVLSDYDEIYGTAGTANKGSQGSQLGAEFPRILPKGVYALARITNVSSSDIHSFVYKLFWAEVAI
jgi:hypothetical protein